MSVAPWPRVYAAAVVAALTAALAAAPGVAQERATQQRAAPDSRGQITLSFAPLVERAAPAVVNIFASRAVAESPVFSPLLDDPFFRRFFGDDLPFGEPRRRQQNALGSGVIVGPDGLVVTNHHVIVGADTIKVVLADRREYAAELVRDDAETDLAILQLRDLTEPLPFIELGDSDELKVGDLVLAIGNPFGVGQTVTSGIVSALARSNVGVSDFNFFIQTDAAINPGNSGGALLRMDGRLAGVNTAIFSRSGGSQGVGFAVPANMVRTVIDSVGRAGALRRPWLGAASQDVTAAIADALGLARPVGVVLSDIYSGGPAARAGLAPGDVVAAVAGHPVLDAGGLRFRLATAPLGSTVAIDAVRDGRPLTLRLPVEVAPEQPPRNTATLAGRQPLAGATVVNLSPAVAEELGVDMFASGVVVTEIGRGSPAARVGLRPLDTILTINGTKAPNVAALLGLVAEPQARWQVAIRRNGRVLSVTVAG